MIDAQDEVDAAALRLIDDQIGSPPFIAPGPAPSTSSGAMLARA